MVGYRTYWHYFRWCFGCRSKIQWRKNNAVLIHAFDNLNVIEGQGGLAVEILEEWPSQQNLDYIFVTVGGGGLASGVGSYLQQMAPDINLIGFEPLGSPSMYNSLKEGKPIVL